MTTLEVHYDHRPELIEILDKNTSIVNMDVTEKIAEDIQSDNQYELNQGPSWIVGVQVKVIGELNRDSLVNQMICDKFDSSQREAALRKGIVNPQDKDYVEFNEYAEKVKTLVSKYGF